MTNKTNRGTMTLLAVLLVAPIMAGCFGGEDEVKAEGPTIGDGVIVDADPNVKTTGVSDALRNETDGAKDLPKAHLHHYWQDRETVTIFDGDIPFNNMNTRHARSNSLVWAEFDLETDGDQVSVAEGGSNSMDVDPAPGGRADVIFAGTSHIELIMPDDLPNGIDKVLFFYKSANTPEFRPEQGIELTTGMRHTIKLNEVGMADPAHQTAVSRWKFRMIGVSQQEVVCENVDVACPPAFVSPNAEPVMQGFQMFAYKGGEEQLDPPHPDFWGTQKTIAYEPVSAEVTSPTFQTPLIRERHAQLNDIAFKPGALVPMGTERVEINVKWTANEQMPDGFYLKLRFHGANGTDYYDPAEVSCSTLNDCTYTVFNYVGDQPQALEDPPYEANSYWRFQLVPTIQDANGQETENVGIFSGSYTISATAHKKEGFILV